MNKAKEIIKNTFENAFDYEQFAYFTKNLLKDVEKASTDLISNQQIKESYQPYINYYRRIWKYTDPNGKIIDVIAVYLKKESTFEARTFQRNFVLDYLKKRSKEAVLASFIHPEQSDWRFSFVKLEFDIKRDPETGKVKDIEKATSAKRYSYLVGENENSHTAQSQLVKLLEDDDASPTLEEIEQSFGVETVTKEFFTKYRELFHDVEENLNNILKADPRVKKDFEKKDIDTVDFAKKLLGQIVFLYFLQKKGWFGVERDNAWGTGSKTFLRDLFERKLTDYSNFFNEILEPLFYEALARERDDNFYSKFNCKIPFLNGGLFDPLNNYDWVHTDIKLPNELFSNSIETKEGDIGDGILDVFDRYNFTVKEDEPLEKEVAIDPEMLGKVFENMLEVKDRKSKGTYYTPREIVHYMCQESLINYLATELEGIVDKKSIEYLVKEAEGFLQHEQARTLGSNYDQKMPDEVIAHALETDQKLSEIKVCDPAIGSGAFPVGMMNEIVKVRSLLTAYLKVKAGRSSYDFKRHAIANSLYGVDIDPSAVEIAKLRLWLSLIVDETDIRNIKPLPNLDYKIMQGNSLLEEYEGIKLFDDSLIVGKESKQQEIESLKNEQDKLQKEFIHLYSNNKLSQVEKTRIDTKLKEIAKQLKFLKGGNLPKAGNMDLFQTRNIAKEKSDKLLQLQKEYFQASQKSEKDSIKKEIDELIWDLIETTVKEEGKEGKLKEIEKFKKSNTRPFFLWHLNFAEVCQSKGGFDVVIGNPPYLRIQGIQKDDPELAQIYKQLYKSATGSFDLYILFLEKGLTLINFKGILNFILPHKWTNSAFGLGIRKLIHNNKSAKKLISFGAYQIFNASNYTSLLWLTKKENTGLEYFEFSRDLLSNQELEDGLNCLAQENYNLISNDLLDENPWVLTDKDVGKVLAKLSKQPLRVKDVFMKIFQGIATSDDKVFVLIQRKDKSNVTALFSRVQKEEVEIEKELLRPFLMGKNVHRYKELRTTNYIIFPYLVENGVYQLMSATYLAKNYPLGWCYLLKNKKRLMERENGRFKANWWCFSRPQNMDYFERQKIVTPEISSGSNMTIDFKGSFFHTTKCYSLLKKSSVKEDYKIFLGILNSRLLWFFLKNTGYVLRGGYFTFKTNYLEPFPLPVVNASERYDQLVRIIDEIYVITNSSSNDLKTKNNLKSLEKQIDQMVYELYGLTEEEIKIVEESINN